VRTWIVLLGFGLPADPAHVCLVLFTMGALGLLPIGIGTGPAATSPRSDRRISPPPRRRVWSSVPQRCWRS
jgi:hypothetical protein